MRLLARGSLAFLLLVSIPSLGTAQASARPSSRPPSTGSRWVIDPVHSQLDFRVRHLLGYVRGTFVDWYGILVTQDEDWTHGTVNVSAQTSSLNTGNRYRDIDLRSARFFATDSFPQLTFESTGIIATDSTVEIGGILTVKGRSRKVTLNGVFNGITRDPEGHRRIAFEAKTRVNRRDFGMELTEVTGASSVVGEEVEITIAIEAVRTN
jgi:polyisoprenoid-binding protein YceI